MVRVCIASKRFIVVKNIANEFIEKFVQKTERLKVGNPLSDDIDIGPLVNASGLKNIDSQVKDSVKEGAEGTYRRGKDGKQGIFLQANRSQKCYSKYADSRRGSIWSSCSDYCGW